MMQAKTVGAVHTHTHTSILINKKWAKKALVCMAKINVNRDNKKLVYDTG